MDAEMQEIERIQRAVAGDSAALTTLLTEARGRLCAHLRQRIPAALRGAIDGDDLVQEAHVEVFQHIGSFKVRDADSFFRWVCTIAMRKLHDAVRRRRADKRGGGRAAVSGAGGNLESSVVMLLDMMADSGRTPSRAIARLEALEAVSAALKVLPDDHRQAVRLVYLEGLAVAQAAERMGRTERAVHNLCYKAKRRLREILGSASRYLSSSG